MSGECQVKVKSLSELDIALCIDGRETCFNMEWKYEGMSRFIPRNRKEKAALSI